MTVVGGFVGGIRLAQRHAGEIVGLAVRIKAEEQALLASLGEPYRPFCASRPRLFLRPWR